MKSYVPNTVKEREEMLKTIGLESMDQLFGDIPEGLKLDRPLDLPAPMSEMEIRQMMMGYVLQNDEGSLIFRGAGAYNHYIPALIPQLVSRSEFYTAYTPYQAEMSQGMLQSIFEYQTVICNLMGMEAAKCFCLRWCNGRSRITPNAPRQQTQEESPLQCRTQSRCCQHDKDLCSLLGY